MKINYCTVISWYLRIRGIVLDFIAKYCMLTFNCAKKLPKSINASASD